MRGDRPQPVLVEDTPTTFTPHARGSTLEADTTAIHEYVYPACAGIDLVLPSLYSRRASLPRMRGDRPYGALSTI